MDIKEESTMKKSNDDNIITIVDNSEEVSENKEPLSRKESSSSSEYVVVCEQPSHLTSPVLEYVANETEINDAIRVVSSSKPLNALPSPTNHANAVVGKSIFYDCLDASPLNENNSFQKSDTDEGEYKQIILLTSLLARSYYFSKLFSMTNTIVLFQMLQRMRSIKMMEISQFSQILSIWGQRI